jgi:hypothetical protein
MVLSSLTGEEKKHRLVRLIGSIPIFSGNIPSPFLPTRENLLSRRLVRLKGRAVIGHHIISGNGVNGVEIAGSQNVLAGNYIGTDKNGGQTIGLASGNGGDGVVIMASGTGNIIGGSVAAATNVICGNGGWGLNLIGSGNTIDWADIGIAVDGTTAFVNTQGWRTGDINGNTWGANDHIKHQ